MSRYYAVKRPTNVCLIGDNCFDEELSINKLKNLQVDDSEIHATIKQIYLGEQVTHHPYSKMQQHLFVSNGALYVRHYSNMLAVIPDS